MRKLVSHPSSASESPGHSGPCSMSPISILECNPWLSGRMHRMYETYVYISLLSGKPNKANNNRKCHHHYWSFPSDSSGIESTYNAGDHGSIPGSITGGGNSNPLQYSCLENSMDSGAWWATVHGATESNMTEHPPTTVIVGIKS